MRITQADCIPWEKWWKMMINIDQPEVLRHLKISNRPSLLWHWEPRELLEGRNPMEGLRPPPLELQLVKLDNSFYHLLPWFYHGFTMVYPSLVIFSRMMLMLHRISLRILSSRTRKSFSGQWLPQSWLSWAGLLAQPFWLQQRLLQTWSVTATMVL